MAEEEYSEECDESEANDPTNNAPYNGSNICRRGRMSSSSPSCIAAGMRSGDWTVTSSANISRERSGASGWSGFCCVWCGIGLEVLSVSRRIIVLTESGLCRGSIPKIVRLGRLR